MEPRGTSDIDGQLVRARERERASQTPYNSDAAARRPYPFNFFSKIWPANCGLAFPFDNLITCPLRKLREATLPALKSATGLGFAAITSSHNFSIALKSLSCSIPLSFTIAAALLPLANISAKTSLPCLPLIFPLSIRSTNSSSASGGIGQSLMVLPAILNAFCKSFRIQFATFLGFFAALAAVQSILPDRDHSPALRHRRGSPDIAGRSARVWPSATQARAVGLRPAEFRFLPAQDRDPGSSDNHARILLCA